MNVFFITSAMEVSFFKLYLLTRISLITLIMKLYLLTRISLTTLIMEFY